MKKILITALLLLTAACSSSEEAASEEESIENNVVITTEGTSPVSSIPETTTMTLSEEATELIKSLPVVKFEDCTEEELKVGDEFPLVIYVGSSSADIKEVFIQIDDEASGMSEYSFSGEDVPTKDLLRTYSLNLEMLDYESEYTIFITAYAIDVEDNQDGKVCSISVKKSDTSETEKERVSDSIPPDVVFLNCPETPIDVKVYNLKWGILSGNADIDYLRIAFWKNGEYDTRVYFEKENHSDIFPFPVANTETYYEQPITRPNEEGEIIMEVFFAIDDEYGNATEKSCVITFKES